ncbi:MAG: hypothetical protein ACTSU4_07985 [Promethearchaeota archaeon]
MGVFENLKLLFIKENWRYTILLCWLIGGIGFMRFLPVVGIFIFLPLLAFLVFLLFFSMVSKKNIEDYPTYQVIILFFISLPFLFLIFIFLVFLALIAVLVYIFLSSWFILYWCYTTAYQIDMKLKSRRFHKFLRGVELIGGFIISLILLGIFTMGSIIYIVFLKPDIPIFINIIYLLIGIIFIGFFIYTLHFSIKNKILISWMGIYLLLISIYTFYLVIQVFLSLSGSETTTLNAQIGLYVLDIALLIYSVSTIISEKAKILAEKIPWFGIDTALIVLIASKACYEFYNNFDYNLIQFVPILQNYLKFDMIIWITSDLSLYKNIGVLIFFILLIIIIGAYEIRKQGYREIEMAIEEFEGETEEDREAQAIEEAGVTNLENLLEAAKREEREPIDNLGESENLEEELSKLEEELMDEIRDEKDISDNSTPNFIADGEEKEDKRTLPKNDDSEH